MPSPRASAESATGQIDAALPAEAGAEVSQGLLSDGGSPHVAAERSIRSQSSTGSLADAGGSVQKLFIAETEKYRKRCADARLARAH